MILHPEIDDKIKDKKFIDDYSELCEALVRTWILTHEHLIRIDRDAYARGELVAFENDDVGQFVAGRNLMAGSACLAGFIEMILPYMKQKMRTENDTFVDMIERDKNIFKPKNKK